MFSDRLFFDLFFLDDFGSFEERREREEVKEKQRSFPRTCLSFFVCGVIRIGNKLGMLVVPSSILSAYACDSDGA